MTINLGQALVHLGANLTGLKEGLAEGKSQTISWATDLGDSVLKLTSGVILGGVTAVATGVAAIGAVAFNTASDIDAATKKASSQIGSLGADTATLGKTITDVYKNNFGASIEDVGEAVAMTSLNMNRFGEMTAEQLQYATERALVLRDTFGEDLGKTTSAANTLMQSFGLTSKQAFDFIQSGYQNGLNASGDFLDSIGEYSVQFADGGATASEFFSVMDSGLKGGMLGTDKAADLFKEFRLRIQDGSTLTADSLAAIGLSMEDITEGLNDGSMTVMDAFTLVQTSMKNADDQTTAFNAGVGLMGSQFEDLGESAVAAIDPLALTMNDISAMQGDINTQYNTWGSLIEGMKRKVSVGLAPIGATLLGIGNKAMPIVTAAFDGFVSFIEPKIQAFADTVTSFFDSFFGKMEEGQTPLDAFKNTLAEFLPPDLMTKIQEVTTAVSDFALKVSDFVQNHSEELKGALIAIGAVLATAAIAAAIGGIAGALATLFSPIGLILGAVALLGAAWEGNWGGIQEKTAAMWEVVKPILDEFVEWFTTTGWPNAVGALTVGWEAAKVVFDALSKWFGEEIMPHLEAFAEWFITTGWPRVTGTLDVGWQAMKLIFDAITKWFTDIQTTLALAQTAWGLVWTSLSKSVAEAMLTIQPVFDAIQKFAEWLGGASFDFNFSLPELPDWAKGGSMPALDLGQLGANMLGSMMAAGDSNTTTVGDVYVQAPAGTTNPADYGQASQNGLQNALRGKGKI